jgi:hypothetical protein
LCERQHTSGKAAATQAEKTPVINWIGVLFWTILWVTFGYFAEGAINAFLLFIIIVLPGAAIGYLTYKSERTRNFWSLGYVLGSLIFAFIVGTILSVLFGNH